MAHLVSSMDVLQREQSYSYAHLTRPMVDYFHEHVFGSFLWETCGILPKDLEGLSPKDRHKIHAGNAARVFNLA